MRKAFATEQKENDWEVDFSIRVHICKDNVDRPCPESFKFTDAKSSLQLIAPH